jgi:hypothetical protein
MRLLFADDVEEPSEKRKRGRPKMNKEPEPEKPTPEKAVTNAKAT